MNWIVFDVLIEILIAYQASRNRRDLCVNVNAREREREIIGLNELRA